MSKVTYNEDGVEIIKFIPAPSTSDFDDLCRDGDHKWTELHQIAAFGKTQTFVDWLSKQNFGMCYSVYKWLRI